MKQILFILSLCIGFAKPIMAQCGARYKQDVSNQLLEWGTNLVRNGFELTHNITFLTLYQNRWDNYRVNLEAGYEYRITAGCDRDCSDLDLKIYDENNNLVDSDVETDDQPVLRVSPRWSGRFTLYVRAYHCSNPPCCIGIAIFGRD